MAGARGIEPRSRVLETLILAVVLCPYIGDNSPSIAESGAILPVGATKFMV